MPAGANHQSHVDHEARAERTVACDDNELVVRRSLVHGDIGVGGDDLLLGREVGVLLEVEVAERS